MNSDHRGEVERQADLERARVQFHNPVRTGVTRTLWRSLDLPDQSPFLGNDYRRIVLTDEVLVGLECTEIGCVAASQSGGLFLTDSYGDWRAMPTQLPALSRFYIGQDAWIACPMSGRRALLSQDAGQTWIRGGFHCSRNSARSVVNTSEITAVLDGGRVRIGGFFDDRIQWRYAPVDNPECLFSGPGALVIIGQTQVAVSRDAGRTYEINLKDFALSPVRDGLVTEKGQIIVVGEAPAGGVPVAISYDFGASWRQPANWPGRDSRADFIARATDGRVAVSKASGRAHVFVADPLGVDWVELAPRETSIGPIASFRDDFILSTTRGIAVAPHERGIYRLGLDQPMQDVVAISQFEYLGLGVFGGVYRSHDRGVNWYPAGPSHSLPFTHLLHLEDERLIAAGAGLVGTSIDGGSTWSLQSTDNGCTVDWLAGQATTHFMGCDDGHVLSWRHADDRWRVLPLPWSASATQGVWSSESASLILMNLDGGQLMTTVDHGQNWTPVELDSEERIVAIDSVGDTLSLRTAGGRLAWKSSGSTQWQWLSSDHALVGDAIAHRRFEDGRWLVLDQSVIWRIGDDLQVMAIGDSGQATRFKILDSGDVFLLGQQSTTLLSRVGGH